MHFYYHHPVLSRACLSFVRLYTVSNFCNRLNVSSNISPAIFDFAILSIRHRVFLSASSVPNLKTDIPSRSSKRSSLSSLSCISLLSLQASALVRKRSESEILTVLSKQMQVIKLGGGNGNAFY